MKDCIPHGYRCSSSENQQAIEMEQVVRRFSVARAVPPCQFFYNFLNTGLLFPSFFTL